MTSAEQHGDMLIDDFLDEWHFHEVHRVRINAPPDRIMTAARAVTWGEAKLGRLLMAVSRNDVTPSRRVLADFDGLQLGERETEMVFGVIGSERGSPELNGPMATEFRAFSEPDYNKIALDFRYADGILSTETRVFCTSDNYRRKFRFYWMLIRGGSGLIRRSVLAAISRRVALETTG
ncbi:hypothetical protein ACLQ28_15085 [Micromonospora sp. DT201]|uniref:hypothetical protein n=1 Tax=Micromonospora sp. DT201 TaxID=3393442 RepID=UPI003CEA624F